MKTTQAIPETLDEIVFRDRNKEYGAYELRKSYVNYITGAVIIAGVLFILMFVPWFIYEKYFSEPPPMEEKIVEIDNKVLPPPPAADPKTPPPPVVPKIPPPPQVKTIKFVPPEIKPDELVKRSEPLTKIDDLNKATASTETKDPGPNADTSAMPPLDPNLMTTTKSVITGTGSGDEVFTAVEQFPTFPGGLEALNKFLSKNVRYPQRAISAGISGKVYVQFVVSADGTIRDNEVIVQKGIGTGCDEEAVRVVRSMPAWNPGRQGGRAVAVRYSIPINFKLD